MEYDSGSSLEDERKNIPEAGEEPTKETLSQKDQSAGSGSSWRLIHATTTNAASAAASCQPKSISENTANRLLSSQVMEYYQKYSQNSNLNQYFSLPTSSYNVSEGTKYYYNIYEFNPKYVPKRQSALGKDYNLKSYIPRERRRWVRPPLIGQSSVDRSSIYVKSMTESKTPYTLVKQQQQQQQQQEEEEREQQHATTSTEALVITEEKSTETTPQDPSESNPKTSSPTSSVASHKPLEWDSGADVGYLYAGGSGLGSSYRFQPLSTLERMALARGCSAALRLDPEGMTEQQQSPGSIQTTVTAAVLSLTTRTSANGLTKVGKPDANSTPLMGNISGSESEIEITPIVKNHPPGIVTGDDIKSDDVSEPKSRKELIKDLNDVSETPKSANIHKLPKSLKCAFDESREKCKSKTASVPPTAESSTSKDVNNSSDSPSPLKKSSSMNLLALPTTRYPLKRSQSELNLCGGDKLAPRLIFNSTSSIATVVNNRPPTCNKLIQTSLRPCNQESIGVQVSESKEEEKPPIPKRAASLATRSLNSILKTSKNTYKIPNPMLPSSGCKSISKNEEENEKDDEEKEEESSSDSSHNASLTPQADDTENVTGRANSFEYFPGHIYENVPNGSTSRVSSVDTGRSNSTMPNTSSSIDEKLWGDSDSLVRDLERSVNILKSLVDANKLDKQVKKRLIHHVVKRLITAKYTDDKIEHNLEENVPWNPADAWNKVCRAEIIQALAKNTTDSSEDWKPTQKKKISKKTTTATDARPIKEIITIPAEIESSNSDKFDRNTDRTVMDGRKARMGLRTDDCERQCESSNTPTNKSESSECFLPQRTYNKHKKIKDIFVTSTANTSPQDQNRALLDAVVNNRRSPLDSSNEAGNSADWRIPTTVSERRYQLRRCSNTDSCDTKLVTYAEMEKRNQLLWITNEISHLLNLKKLLEQPKTKTEWPLKSSPRKSKQPCAKTQKSLPAVHNYHHQNGDVLEDDQLNTQWSSHCNLANCPPTMGARTVRRLKKRNSCTQTATDSSSAYSRTGSEIVSAKIQNPKTKLTNAYAQTLVTQSSSISTSYATRIYSGCPLHLAFPAQSYTCDGRVCLCCKTKNLCNDACTTKSKSDTQCKAKTVCNSSESIKETKNKLNTNNLKCSCQLNGKSISKLTVGEPKKLTVSSQTCDQHHCEDSICSCAKHNSTKSCQCSRDCQCENKVVHSLEKLQISRPVRKKLFEKATSTGCLCTNTCDCKNLEETDSSTSECNCQANKKTQSFYLVNSSKDTNSKSCYRTKKVKDREKAYISPKYSTRTDESSSSDCKCCRMCGTVYQKDRTCGCIFKKYPKPVAYELSFVNNDKNIEDTEGVSCSKIDIEMKCIKKSIKSRDENQHDGNFCACRDLQRPMKRCDCNYRGNARRCNNVKKNTLQEYLKSNNPRFADNVETRRQYVSEIQRLRQLRKDRRVQLLAMASTSSNIFAPPKPVKAMKSIQKKMTEADMRTRLRKKYYQLSEVRAKRKQQQLQEQARCNKLMAKIFCKKLQQKVLRGQVDLSQSISVISNL